MENRQERHKISKAPLVSFAQCQIVIMGYEKWGIGGVGDEKRKQRNHFLTKSDQCKS